MFNERKIITSYLLSVIENCIKFIFRKSVYLNWLLWELFHISWKQAMKLQTLSVQWEMVHTDLNKPVTAAVGSLWLHNTSQGWTELHQPLVWLFQCQVL